MSGPMSGLRVVELASLGPGPHAGMLLADWGADVVRVVRPDTPLGGPGTESFTLRGRTSVTADLKEAGDNAAVRKLIDSADVLVEGFRPGVTERLGLGPDVLTRTNPRLVYARITGWGQDGPLAQTAGHDINYIALTGALHAIGTEDHPVPPLNLVGDYGGGSMFLVAGILAALWERERSGLGQVLDVAMADGVAMLLQPILELRAEGSWTDERYNNIIDGAAPFYRTYECADGRHVAVGAIEPQFYRQLIDGLGLDPESLPDKHDREHWPSLTATLGEVFHTRTRAEWADIFAEADACVTPVLTFAEAAQHPHMGHRGVLVNGPDGVSARSAPRFSRGSSDVDGVGTPGQSQTLETVAAAWMDTPAELGLIAARADTFMR